MKLFCFGFISLCRWLKTATAAYFPQNKYPKTNCPPNPSPAVSVDPRASLLVCVPVCVRQSARPSVGAGGTAVVSRFGWSHDVYVCRVQSRRGKTGAAPRCRHVLFQAATVMRDDMQHRSSLVLGVHQQNSPRRRPTGQAFCCVK